MKQQAKKLQELNDADFKGWLGGAAGRRTFIRLVTQAGLYSPSYAESPTATAYNEGRRSFALGLLSEAKRVCPELYLQALKEQLADEVEAAKPEEPAED